MSCKLTREGGSSFLLTSFVLLYSEIRFKFLLTDPNSKYNKDIVMTSTNSR